MWCALLQAAIVAYARPFCAKRGGAEWQAHAVSLKPRKVLSEEAQRTLHRHVLFLRNEAVAHSNPSRRPSQRIPRRDAGVSAWTMHFDVLAEHLDVSLFRDMAWRMRMVCVEHMREVDEHLRASDVHPGDQSDPGNGVLTVTLPLAVFMPRE